MSGLTEAAPDGGRVANEFNEGSQAAAAGEPHDVSWTTP